MIKNSIYICSPLKGNKKTMQKNIANAKKYCKTEFKKGKTPIAPHIYFTQFMNENKPAERKRAMKAGIELLKNCEEVKVYGNRISEGMRKEIQAAKRHKIKIWRRIK